MGEAHAAAALGKLIFVVIGIAIYFIATGGRDDGSV